MAAQKVGADLAYIFCANDAAINLRSRSPDLTVIPVLDSSNPVMEIKPWLRNIHALVFGPGLGTDKNMIKSAKDILVEAIKLEIPVVIGGQVMSIVMDSPKIIHGYKQCILTLSDDEFQLAYDSIVSEKHEHSGVKRARFHTDIRAHNNQQTVDLAKSLGGVTVINGNVITNGSIIIQCNAGNGNTTCEHSRDALSGSLGTFLYWATNETLRTESKIHKTKRTTLAAYGSIFISRMCNVESPNELINTIGGIFRSYLEHDEGNVFSIAIFKFKHAPL